MQRLPIPSGGPSLVRFQPLRFDSDAMKNLFHQDRRAVTHWHDGCGSGLGTEIAVRGLAGPEPSRKILGFFRQSVGRKVGDRRFRRVTSGFSRGEGRFDVSRRDRRFALRTVTVCLAYGLPCVRFALRTVCLEYMGDRGGVRTSVPERTIRPTAAWGRSGANVENRRLGRPTMGFGDSGTPRTWPRRLRRSCPLPR